jgi:myo-inositol 2-dehydrogenase/D-chiro-inositol 1-dehydrogenase
LAQLHFRSGAIGHIECNVAAAYGYEVEVKITCQTGAVETPPPPSPHIRHAGHRGQSVDPDWLVRFDTAYIAEARAWVNDLHAGCTTGPSAWDGYVSLLAADACTESARTGQPVKLLIPDMPAIYRRAGSPA